MLENNQQHDDQSMSPALLKLKDQLDRISIRHYLSSLERGISGLGHQFVVQNACLGDLSEGMESGFKHLETRVNKHELHIKELSEDMDACFNAQPDDMTVSFKQVVEYHMKLEDQIDTRFNQVNARLDQVESAIASVKEDLKNDMEAMEGRLLDTIKQLFVARKSV